MKWFSVFFASISAFNINAQSYSISFSGLGLSTVKVQNLNSGLVADVQVGDVLFLSTVLDTPEELINYPGINVYPNPTTDIATLEIVPPYAGYAVIHVCDLKGQVITHLACNLDKDWQVFNISGIKPGMYIINVQGYRYKFSKGMISLGKSTGTAAISMISKGIESSANNKEMFDSKEVKSIVEMAYNPGERLIYTAISGNSSTVMTDIPSEDKLVSFTFIECKDGDNNYYSVLEINTQLWMVENLKTTKLNDGTTLVPNVTEDLAWNALITPGYCWYDNDIAHRDTYGALYNWHTINTGNLCPLGWHVPNDIEWTSLTTYLGGLSVAGGKLKESGMTHWTSFNIAATNESGFTALPGGIRDYGGAFSSLHENGIWWSSTEVDEMKAWNRHLNSSHSAVNRGSDNKKYGLSVRCVKD